MSMTIIVILFSVVLFVTIVLNLMTLGMSVPTTTHHTGNQTNQKQQLQKSCHCEGGEEREQKKSDSNVRERSSQSDLVPDTRSGV